MIVRDSGPAIRTVPARRDKEAARRRSPRRVNAHAALERAYGDQTSPMTSPTLKSGSGEESGWYADRESVSLLVSLPETYRK